MKDMFKDILKQPGFELDDIPRFSFDELPPLKQSFTEKEKKEFTKELKSRFKNIQKELTNEMSARYIIDTFLLFLFY